MCEQLQPLQIADRWCVVSVYRCICIDLYWSILICTCLVYTYVWYRRASWLRGVQRVRAIRRKEFYATIAPIECERQPTGAPRHLVQRVNELWGTKFSRHRPQKTNARSSERICFALAALLHFVRRPRTRDSLCAKQHICCFIHLAFSEHSLCAKLCACLSRTHLVGESKVCGQMGAGSLVPAWIVLALGRRLDFPSELECPVVVCTWSLAELRRFHIL